MTLGPLSPLSYRRVPQAGPQGGILSPWSPYVLSLLLGTTYCSSLPEGILESGVQDCGQYQGLISLFSCGVAMKK